MAFENLTLSETAEDVYSGRNLRKIGIRPHNPKTRPYTGRNSIRHNREYRAMTRRILRMYDRAPSDIRSQGEAWYANAFEAALQMLEDCIKDAPLDYGGANLRDIATVEMAAGIISALSPRCRWSVNLEWAREMLWSVDYDGEPAMVQTGRNRENAYRIAIGCNPEDILRGPKTRAFYRNILGDYSAVTVDAWAASVAFGHPVARFTTAAYHRIAAAYRHAAELRNVRPAILQAIVWIMARGRAE